MRKFSCFYVNLGLHGTDRGSDLKSVLCSQKIYNMLRPPQLNHRPRTNVDTHQCDPTSCHVHIIQGTQSAPLHRPYHVHSGVYNANIQRPHDIKGLPPPMRVETTLRLRCWSSNRTQRSLVPHYRENEAPSSDS